MIEIPCRPATPDEIPRTARRLAETAEAHGWEVAITYARSEHFIEASNGRRAYVTAKGRAVAAIPPRDAYTKTIDHIAVRMWREGKLIATWENGQPTRGLSLSRTFTLTELRKLVQMTRPQLAEWLEAWRNEGREAA